MKGEDEFVAYNIGDESNGFLKQNFTGANKGILGDFSECDGPSKPLAFLRKNKDTVYSSQLSPHGAGAPPESGSPPRRAPRAHQ